MRLIDMHMRHLGLTVAIAAMGFSAQSMADDRDMLESLIAADHRSDSNIARNEYRHPVETLEFFGLESGMTVVEILPGGGWYTEILAPFLKSNGQYYACLLYTSPSPRDRG